MSLLENRIPPPFVTLAIGLAMLGGSFMSARPPELMFRMPLTALFFAAALLFGAPAVRAFRRAQTTIDPVHVGMASVVVSTGVYRITRNPMYVAMTFLLLSWAVYLANLWLLIGPLAFVLFITRFQILPEERAMAAKFGASYLNYRAQVRRWL